MPKVDMKDCRVSCAVRKILKQSYYDSSTRHVVLELGEW
jgi:hypothetical protein